MRPIVISLATLLMTSACAISDQHEAGDTELPDGAENCLHLRTVDRIEILDEQHILFHMRNGEIFNNHLPRKCPGLRRDDTIMYRTTLNQLCSIDMFTVLENIGGGFLPGTACSFGKFYPATEEEVDAMKARQRE